MPPPNSHRRAAILSIGDELTLGQTLNTNSQWLSEQLAGIGIVTVEHVTIPDDLDAHVATLKRLASQVDVIISSGGLGPTADDLTRQAVALASDDVLMEDAASMKEIEAFFVQRKRKMNELNRVQALRPSRAAAISNPHGTAPGFHAVINTIDCFCAPGPPNELFPMFRDSILPRLRPPPGLTVRTRALGTIGMGESDIAGRLGPLMDRTHVPLVGTTASNGIVTCRLRYEGPLAAAEADALLAATEAKIRTLLAPHVFSSGHNSLARSIIERLIENRLTISTVESCTGGMLGAALTDIPGSSAAFIGGLLTYTNELKTRLAGVPVSTFKSESIQEAPGAVSREAALAMAQGGLRATGSSLCISVTGIAGPDGGTPQKPVGTVWIGLATASGDTNVRRFAIPGTRQSVRTWSVTAALAMVWMHLQGRPDLLLPRQVE